MVDIEIVDLNTAYIQVNCERGIQQEISEYFTFEISNAKFNPLVKKHLWDGKIKLFSKQTRQMYAGLKHRLVQWAEAHNYTHNVQWPCNALSPYGWDTYIKKFNIPFEVNPEQLESQIDLFRRCIEQGRGTVVSPTGSGKSFIIYLLLRHYAKKTLIIVPTINLVNQMAADFKDYGYTGLVAKKYSGPQGAAGGGTDKADVVISTWQSIYEYPPEWFDQFELVFGDECHGFKAKSLIQLMTSMQNTPYRFGFTGTLDGVECNEWILEGLFGPVIQGESIKELQDKNVLSELEVKIIILEYSKEDRKKLQKQIAEARALAKKKHKPITGVAYNVENDFIVNHERRYRFIKNLSLSLDGSSFVLFRLVGKHGNQLFADISRAKPGFSRYVHGGVDGESREEIRIEANENDELIVVASYGVFSGGVNVPNLRNIIFASPYKSKIKVLQSIGRGLRRTKTKQKVTIIDIVDNLSEGSFINYSIKHFGERLKIYNQEQFPYKQLRVPFT